MPNSVSVMYAQSLLRLIKVPPEVALQVVQELGLPAAVLDSTVKEADLPAEAFGRLFIALMRLAQYRIEGDAKAAERVNALSNYRLLFTYMLQGLTLGDALQRAGQFFGRFHPQGQTFSLHTTAEQTLWLFDLGELLEQEARLQDFSMAQLNWLPGLAGRVAALSMWHRMASWLIGSFVDLERVNIDCPAQGQARQFVEGFRAPLYFNQAQCSLVFHSRYLDLPVVQREADLTRMLDTFPAELLLADRLVDSTSARVKGLLGSDYSGELPGLEQVAERLYTTAPTLHRRLKAEGTSYQQIKDGLRRDAAVGLLRQQQLSGAQIAERLGFSDASTFYRAFKKWTGMTPQAFLQSES